MSSYRQESMAAEDFVIGEFPWEPVLRKVPVILASVVCARRNMFHKIDRRLPHWKERKHLEIQRRVTYIRLVETAVAGFRRHAWIDPGMIFCPHTPF